MTQKLPEGRPRLRLVAPSEDQTSLDPTVMGISAEMAERVFKGYTLDDSEFQGVGTVTLQLVLRNGNPATYDDIKLATEDALSGFAKMGYNISFVAKANGSNVIVLTAPNNKQINKLELNNTLATVFENRLSYYFALAWKKKS